MKNLKPQDRKKNYTKMKSEDFKAICGLLFEDKTRPIVTYKILGETRRIPEK